MISAKDNEHRNVTVTDDQRKHSNVNATKVQLVIVRFSFNKIEISVSGVIQKSTLDYYLRLKFAVALHFLHISNL